MPTLAHLGGIDEIGVFLVPAVLMIVVLRIVEKRSRRNQESEKDSQAP